MAFGDGYADMSSEDLRRATKFIDMYEAMPRFNNGQADELDELIQNKALDVPFMIRFDFGKICAVQVGGEIKIIRLLPIPGQF